MPTAFTYNPSVQVLDFEEVGLLIQMACLICGFCSLGHCFAFGFLQIPPRGGHPCRSANDSPCRVRRRLSLPSKSALPGAPTESPRRAGSQGRRETFSLVCHCPHPSDTSPLARILSNQLLESNQKLLRVLLGGYFLTHVSIRFCIVIFPATVLTFNQSRQRENA